jgi:hypothetical protein
MRKFHFIAGLLLIMTLLTIWGCDERISNSKTKGYYIEGVVTRNQDNDSILALAQFKRNDTILTAAQILIGSDTLKYDSGLYTKSYAHINLLATGTTKLYLTDSNRFDESVSFTIPAGFQISSVSPANRLNAGGTSVGVDWSSSAGSNGYALGVVLADSAYKSSGWTEFITTGVTSDNIPPDAFRLSGNLDTGWYYIYVYSYAGSPAFEADLPTAFPSGLEANISRLNFSGMWGAINVASRDSMHVVAQ